MYWILIQVFQPSRKTTAFFQFSLFAKRHPYLTGLMYSLVSLALLFSIDGFSEQTCSSDSSRIPFSQAHVGIPIFPSREIDFSREICHPDRRNPPIRSSRVCCGEKLIQFFVRLSRGTSRNRHVETSKDDGCTTRAICKRNYISSAG